MVSFYFDIYEIIIKKITLTTENITNFRLVSKEFYNITTKEYHKIARLDTRHPAPMDALKEVVQTSTVDIYDMIESLKEPPIGNRNLKPYSDDYLKYTNKRIKNQKLIVRRFIYTMIITDSDFTPLTCKHCLTYHFHDDCLLSYFQSIDKEIAYLRHTPIDKREYEINLTSYVSMENPVFSNRKSTYF
jgi:hypothetical protein